METLLVTEMRPFASQFIASLCSRLLMYYHGASKLNKFIARSHYTFFTRQRYDFEDPSAMRGDENEIS